jgi:hypothetical protein
MPSFLETLADLVEERGLHALLIGGHAVTALGFPRATYDVDLLIPETESEKWEAALFSLGLRKIHESPALLPFQAPKNCPLPPVDLMRVDSKTWDRLASDSTPLLKLPTGDEPVRHEIRSYWNPVEVEAHFAPLLEKLPPRKPRPIEGYAPFVWHESPTIISKAIRP